MSEAQANNESDGHGHGDHHPDDVPDHTTPEFVLGPAGPSSQVMPHRHQDPGCSQDTDQEGGLMHQEALAFGYNQSQ